MGLRYSGFGVDLVGAWWVGLSDLLLISVDGLFWILVFWWVGFGYLVLCCGFSWGRWWFVVVIWLGISSDVSEFVRGCR